MGQSPLAGIEASHALAESKLLSAIVNSSDDAIVGKTVSGVITSWNPAAEKIYGYRAEEIVGQPMTVLCPPAGPARSARSSTRSAVVRSSRTTRPSGGGRTAHGAGVGVGLPHPGRGRRPDRSSSIARDITEQRQARAVTDVRRRATDLEQANGSLEAFTYSVAHDLRAPLRSLAGFSAALLEDCGDGLGEEGRRYAERIQASSERMSALIDDLLEFPASRVPRYTFSRSISGLRWPGSPRTSSAARRIAESASSSRTRSGLRRIASSSARSWKTWSGTPGSSPRVRTRH